MKRIRPSLIPQRPFKGRSTPLCPLCLCGSILLGIGTLTFPARAQTPSYAQVQAVFNKHCVSCHNPEDEDGELILESHASLLEGGESGPVIVPGKSDESLLL